MGFKSFLVKPFARKISKNIHHWATHAKEVQQQVFRHLIDTGQHTAFGKDHQFETIRDYESFRQQVPIRDYEKLRPYVDRIKEGEADVLWREFPKYFAKTSGTTSGVKYIPITRDSVPNHINTARNALFNYIAQTGNGNWLDGKVIFLSGSPVMTKVGGILTGRLSGISNHMVPAWLKGNQLPSYHTNCMEEWEEKVDKIVEETAHQDMRLISGIPPWVQMYYERLLEYTGKNTIKEIFPNFSIFVYGGVNYEPYRSKLEELVGEPIHSLETYPASEGFIAFQDSQDQEGLLLNVKSGIFYEFVPAGEIFNDHPTRLSLEEVEIGVNYAVIINSNAGLWGYNIGDTVEFVSLAPPRIKVTGRIKHFISAFGEHVIGKEVEQALLHVANEQTVRIVEFTVAPQVNPSTDTEQPYHEWFIEFDKPPDNPNAFAAALDQQMVRQNIYYADLIKGNILQPLKVTLLRQGAFREYMKSKGKLGGQNKVPRLSNDRKIAEELEKYKMWREVKW